MQPLKSIDNMELNEAQNYVLVSINPKIYPLSVVFSAAYIMLDRAYTVIDGDPEKEIVVTLRPKEQAMKLERLARDFNDELINYAVHLEQSKRTQKMREEFIKKALSAHGVGQSLEDASKVRGFGGNQ